MSVFRWFSVFFSFKSCCVEGCWCGEFIGFVPHDRSFVFLKFLPRSMEENPSKRHKSDKDSGEQIQQGRWGCKLSPELNEI